MKLKEMLKDMDTTELLILYHETLRQLIKKGINPLREE